MGKARASEVHGACYANIKQLQKEIKAQDRIIRQLRAKEKRLMQVLLTPPRA